MKLPSGRQLGGLIVNVGAGLGVLTGLGMAVWHAITLRQFNYLSFSYGFGASLTAATTAIAGHAVAIRYSETPGVNNGS